jgi:hypothetical protein
VDLEIERHERFQVLEWRWQRLGWAVLGAFVLAGLVGLLGPGPLSSTTRTSGPVTVRFDRVTHHEADDTVTLVLGPEAIRNGTITAELSGSWLAGVDVQGITPEPSAQRAIPGGGTVLEFEVEKPGEVEASMSFRPQQHGTISADLTVGQDTVSFSQFVMP